MAKRIKPIDLSKAVAEVLDKYGSAADAAIRESVEQVSKEAVEKLQAVSTFAPGGHPSGDYSKSWTVEDVKTGRFRHKAVVHNEEHYRLSHLLEKGHVTRNGTGRTFRRTPAYPHIAPVNEWAASELPKEVERRLRNI